MGRSGKTTTGDAHALALHGEGLLLDLQDEASTTALLFETRGEGAVTTVQVESSVDKVTWVELFAALDVSPGKTTAAAKMLIHFAIGDGNATKVRGAPSS